MFGSIRRRVLEIGRMLSSEVVPTDLQILEKEILAFKASPKRRHMIKGEAYFVGEHDILRRKRTVIGEGGKLVDVKNLPNNRIVDNQYKKMVVQKANYLLGKPFTMQSMNDDYLQALKQVCNRGFMRTLQHIATDSLNAGIGWIYPHYDENGELKFKRFAPWEICPIWQDSEHTVLECAIRLYVVELVGKSTTFIEKVEVYTTKGVDFYELSGGSLKAVEPYHQDYFQVDEAGYNWQKVPLIKFAYNSKEIPLLKMVKSLQDGLNLIESNFQNQMEEDSRNTILVLVNYDGENLGEFRKNLATYGAVKVRTVDGAPGDLKTLQVEVNSENYKTILELFKKAIIENAMGYDAKDDRMSGNPNQMNIKSMYSDIDLDANAMEMEFQASLEQLLWFVKQHFYNTGVGDFEGEHLDIVFNRDILINEAEAIANCTNSLGLLSEESVIAHHPWVFDLAAEMERKGNENNTVDDYAGFK